MIDFNRIQQSRDLPEIDILGKPFVVDTMLWELRQKDDLSNVIRLRDDDTIVSGDKYLIAFDSSRFCVRKYDTQPKDVVIVEIDQLVKIDPPEMARLYDTDVDLLPALDKEIRPSAAQLEELFDWKGYPKINILGKEYEVQLEFERLVDTKDPTNCIVLPEEAFGKYRFIYDRDTEEFHCASKPFLELPDNPLIIEIPGSLWLDPITKGLLKKREEDYYVGKLSCRSNLPVSKSHEARIIPLDRSSMVKVLMDIEKQMFAGLRKVAAIRKAALSQKPAAMHRSKRKGRGI